MLEEKVIHELLNSRSHKSVTYCKWNRNSSIKKDKGYKIKHSQQFSPQDHLHLVTGVVATETQSKNMVGASLAWAQHAGRAPDRWQVEILRLAGTHPDLVPQSVVYHSVTLLADREKMVSYFIQDGRTACKSLFFFSFKIKSDLFLSVADVSMMPQYL